MTFNRFLLLLISLISSLNLLLAETFVGKVVDESGSPLPGALIAAEGAGAMCASDAQGHFRLDISSRAKSIEAKVSFIGYETQLVKLHSTHSRKRNKVALTPNPAMLNDLVVVGTRIGSLNGSAYNATVMHTDKSANAAKSLGDVLGKAPGVKIREQGGVGSDVNINIDGFGGKHIKVFMDGVPIDGATLNSIPVNVADRVEVYRGVVPVGLGADAPGGVVNIITRQRSSGRWYADASLTYGSFNTIKSHLNVGQTFANGWTYELSAYTNRSDNNYRVLVAVEDFATGAINRRKPQWVTRFNAFYRNEAAALKAGIVGKPWADRLLATFTLSDHFRAQQNGVRQEIVYGQKHRHGYSINPGLEYAKRGLAGARLDLTFNAGWHRDVTVNVDTAMMKYNWRGETAPLNSPGEQSLLHQRLPDNRVTTNFAALWRAAEAHQFTLNHVLNSFVRHTENLLTSPPSSEEFAKSTLKNIVGFSWRFAPVKSYNISAFGKFYSQRVAGAVATTAAADKYMRSVRTTSTPGYGGAATWFLPGNIQLKASYEHACRLPSSEEIFGNGDLEQGEFTLRPERSHNANLNFIWTPSLSGGSLYLEAALLYRNMSDYIQRNILSLSGGKSAATYINYGRVFSRGVTLSTRYSPASWLEAGGNFSYLDVRDNMPTAQGSSAPNPSYRQRMPNLPYLFADFDLNVYCRLPGRKNSMLTFTYDNQYIQSYSYYASNIGSDQSDWMIPAQFAHNIALSYSFGRGRYHITAECRNLTDERLYDHFSLQKPGRAFYAKVRVNFGNK